MGMGKIGIFDKFFETRLVYVFLFVLFIILFYILLSLYQQSRYNIETYNCTHMSYECAGFFAKFGVPVELVTGYKYNSNGSIEAAHMWLRLWGWLEFESTTLMFSDHRGYRVVSVERFN